jgi:protein-S-isoprenylcysteine O-methyltransferase Ste14
MESMAASSVETPSVAHRREITSSPGSRRFVVSGIAATLMALRGMGTSWQIGVDQAESTALVTGGLFAHVRNPVFTAMITTGIGLTLLAPNVIALGALVALVLAIEIQVRVVEEPYLLRTHGEAYMVYASRAGRFLPGLGRSSSSVS